MKFRERLIHFQNRSEKNFQHSRSLRSSANYGLAIILFIASTLFAGFSLPFRLLAKAFTKKNETRHISNIRTENLEDTQEQEPGAAGFLGGMVWSLPDDESRIRRICQR